VTFFSMLTRFLSRSPRAAGRRAKPRLSVEALEDRTVPTVSFGSALRIGPDQPTDYGTGWGRDVATDASGNVYITGMFNGTVDFDPAHPNTDGILQSKNNTTDGYVAKYAAGGAFEWARRMGGDNTAGPSDMGEAVAVDGSGNVYVVGDFSSNADFGSFTPTSGDVFVTKLDSSGNFQWVQTYTDHPYNDSLQDIAVDGSGNVYVTRSSSTAGAVVTKLDPSNGATVWSDNFGDGGRGIKADAAGNVFVTGVFRGTVDFNPGPGTSNLTSPKVKGQYADEGFVVKLTTDNNFVWARQITEVPNDLALDGSDNVYTAGASGNSLQLGSGGPLNVTKLSANGTLLWSKNFANGAQNAAGAAAFGVAVDGSGNVYTTGYYTGTADFDPGSGTSNLTSGGDRDIYVSQFDTNGNYAWAGGMRGAGSDQAAGMCVDGAGNIYTTGLYGASVSGATDYTVDFDPGTGVYDLAPVTTRREIFVSKLLPFSSGLASSTSAASPRIGSFTASLDPATSGSLVTLTAANITDGLAGATITQVTFYARDSNGNLVTLGTATQDSTGAWTLAVTVNLAPGSYTLYAQAQDSGGVFSDPLALTLQVL
jgi:hypothetical protein